MKKRNYILKIRDLSHDPKDPGYAIDLIKPKALIMGDNSKELATGIELCFDEAPPKNKRIKKNIYYIFEIIEKNKKDEKYKATVPVLAESIIYAESIPEIEEGIKALLKYEKIQYKNLIGCKMVKSKIGTVSKSTTSHS